MITPYSQHSAPICIVLSGALRQSDTSRFYSVNASENRDFSINSSPVLWTRLAEDLQFMLQASTDPKSLKLTEERKLRAAGSTSTRKVAAEKSPLSSLLVTEQWEQHPRATRKRSTTSTTNGFGWTKKHNDIGSLYRVASQVYEAKHLTLWRKTNPEGSSRIS